MRYWFVTKNSDNTYTYYQAWTVASGSGVVSVANPFLKSDYTEAKTKTGEDKETDGSVEAVEPDEITISLTGSYSGLTNSNVINGSNAKTYNITKMLKGLVDVESDGTVKADSSAEGKLNSLTTVAKIKEVGDVYSGIFDEVYKGAMKKFREVEWGEVSSLFSTNNGYIGNNNQVTTSSLFDYLLPQKDSTSGSVVDESAYTVANLANAASVLNARSTNLKALDAAVKEWVIAKADSGIKDSNGLLKSTLMWKNTLDLTNSNSTLVKVLNGSLANATAIASAVSALDDVYEEGVEEYATECKAFIDSLYTSLHQSASTMKIAKNLESVYNMLLKVYGYDATGVSNSNMWSVPTTFNMKSYDSINAYYECFAILLKGYADSDTEWYGKTAANIASITNTDVKTAITIGASVISDGDAVSTYQWAAFMGALADQGVDITKYCLDYNSGTAKKFDSSEAALNAIKTRLNKAA